MTDEGCRALCIGLGIHYPYYINTAFPAGITGGMEHHCFSPTQREDFSRYVESALLPAITCALEWLDAGHRCAFSLSGLVVEQLNNDDTTADELLVQALKHRNSEVLGQTYYHSVAALFADKSEFIGQVTAHSALMEGISGKKPHIFENTEFAFNSDLAALIRDMGFSALYSEGYDHLLSATHPNSLYSCRGLPVLLRNCRLSDDLAYRYFDRGWDQYPLTADKFAGWVANTPGDCIHLFLDARTFSPAREDPAGFREFFCQLPDALLEREVRTTLPADSLQGMSRGELSLEDLGLCLPYGTCSLTGIQNILQQSAFWCLEEGALLVADREQWRRLQATDHFIRMTIRSGSCGRQVSQWTNQETHDYFSAYMRALGYLEWSCSRLHRSRTAVHALRCLAPERAFHFFTGQRYTGYSAHSLFEFCRLLEFVPGSVFTFHQERGDFSRWITEVLGDRTLAGKLAGCRDPAEARAVVGGRIRDLCRRLP